MAHFLRYSGEFLSRRSVACKVEIYQEADMAFPIVGTLAFPAHEPLVIEWKHTDKHEVLCGSSATLTVVSPGDRTYEDLYTIAPGCIRMDVLRNGQLYWSGTLDPEFYEEPYAYGKEYEVSLTFSDFGILERLKHNLFGMRSLNDILLYALRCSKLNYKELNQDYLTSYLTDKMRATLDRVSLRNDNFYDEDGEPCTLHDVVEGMLQPLALRLVQRNGSIWVYDLNGLFQEAPGQKISWSRDNQMMGVDQVVNNAKVTFSPYAEAKLLDKKVEYEDVYSVGMTNLTSDRPSDGEYYSYYPDYLDDHKVGSDWDYSLLSFTIFLSDKGSGLAGKYGSAKYFHIQPLLGGQESSGVAFSFYTGGHGALTTGRPKRKLLPQTSKQETVLMKTHRIFVPKLEEAERKKYYLRLSMEMLIDARYNPFTDANDGNEKGNYNNMKNKFNFVTVPATITLYDEGGKPLMHYSNEEVMNAKDITPTLYWTAGKWMNGASTYNSCRLQWYDPEDLHFSSGVLGWKKNRHCIGYTHKELFDSFKKMQDGQYIPYPESGGYLEVCIYVGIRITEWTKSTNTDLDNDWYNKIRWMLYKAPQLEVVLKDVLYSDAGSNDVEYTGTINQAAKEDIKLDTICGTMAEVNPTAKGVYFRTSDSCQLKELTRAGRKNQAEQLLIGTLYSQYAERRTLLSGTADILDTDLAAYTEACQEGKRFICLADVQNIIADESELEVVELRPDEYKSDKE